MFKFMFSLNVIVGDVMYVLVVFYLFFSNLLGLDI